MKRFLVILLAFAILFSLVACGKTVDQTTTTKAQTTTAPQVTTTTAVPTTVAPTTKEAATEPAVGTDVVEVEAVGSGQYDPTYIIALKVIGPKDDILYDGTVSLKSPTMYASEFLKAAITDKGLAQEGIDIGFVTTLGDYVNNSEQSLYWLYSVNGNSADFGCNQLQLRDGDYMEWTYGAWVDLTAEPVVGEWAFEVGNDVVETEAVGSGQYDPVYTVSLKVIGAADDVLYNGTVKLKSPTMLASEFLKAAITDKGLAQDGIDVGFVTTLGAYVNNSEQNLYWLYTVNGVSPSFGCNQFQLRDGDYLLWEYKTPVW